MNNSKNSLYNPFFSHIYVEEDAYNYTITQQVLGKFPHAKIVPIAHYKDIFNRPNQNFIAQKNTPNLILAVKHSQFVYPGAPVCQNFGHQHFYYTSSVMNCIYDCEYCYLQGMYPSANLVIFVNLEDIFSEIELLLEKHPVYLCISYDTDLLALEPMLGYVEKWHEFTLSHQNLTIELRTKSANFSSIEHLLPFSRFILSFTLSPIAINEQFEHHTPSIKNRIANIQSAINKGHNIRLCFDPILAQPNWKEHYSSLIKSTFELIDSNHVIDVSIGVFRVGSDYMKRMRNQRKHSVILNYPYINDHGVFHYSKECSTELTEYVKKLLTNYVSYEKIYEWKETVEK